MIALLMLALSVSPPAPARPTTEFCWDTRIETRTASVARALTHSETEIYRIAERAAAVARGWRVEALKQERWAEIEKKRADDAEARLINAPPAILDHDEDLSTPIWLFSVAVVVAFLAGGFACAHLGCSL